VAIQIQRSGDRLDIDSDLKLVGQDCILLPVSNRLFVLTIPVRTAPMQSARSLQSCPTERQSRNQNAGYSGEDRRNRLSHQEIVAGGEEIKML
jgi:hypothetical protein